MTKYCRGQHILLTLVPLLGGLHATKAHAAAKFTTLLSFNGSNGSLPQARLTVDSIGNLYGTTGMGGVYPGSNGIVFELSGPSHTTFTTIAKFKGVNGATPLAPITVTTTGELFGTASTGGSANGGTAFQLTGETYGRIKTLATFMGANGSTPESGLIGDSAGNLFGTTYSGGAGGYGTVFELSGATHRHLVSLHTFSGPDGAFSQSPLVADAAGDLYGTMVEGGAQSIGVAFELSGSDHKTFRILASFDGVDGGYPEAGLIIDPSGNLFGTTSDMAKLNGGTIFELSGADHTTVTTLHSFGLGRHSGTQSIGGLLIDSAGNLYGTTPAGGSFGDGTIYKLSADHEKFTVLHEFKGGSEGIEPMGGLIADSAGNLYGSTIAGGPNNLGTVFELSGAGFAVRK